MKVVNIVSGTKCVSTFSHKHTLPEHSLQHDANDGYTLIVKGMVEDMLSSFEVRDEDAV